MNDDIKKVAPIGADRQLKGIMPEPCTEESYEEISEDDLRAIVDFLNDIDYPQTPMPTTPPPTYTDEPESGSDSTVPYSNHLSIAEQIAKDEIVLDLGLIWDEKLRAWRFID